MNPLFSALYERYEARFSEIERQACGANGQKDKDLVFMRFCLEAAQDAAALGEVPIAALLVDPNGRILGLRVNEREHSFSPFAHAESLVIQACCEQLKTWRLEQMTLYVSLEPCMMCCGAISQARVGRLVYAAPDPKAGFVQSQAQLLDSPIRGHRVNYVGGILEDTSSHLLKDFFQGLRARNQQIKHELGSTQARKAQAKAGKKPL